MRYALSLFVLVVFLFGCNQKGKVNEANASVEELQDTVYTIHGYIKGGKTGTKAVLAIFGVDRIPDTAVFNGDEFEFKGSVPEPLMGEITILDTNQYYSQPLKLMVENAYINIEGNVDSIHKATVIGGIHNPDFTTLKKVIRLYTDSIFALLIAEQQASRLNDTVRLQKVRNEYNGMNKEIQRAVRQYAIEHPKSIASAFYVYNEFMQDINVVQLDSIYSSFDSTILNTLYVKKIKAALDAAKRTAIGQTAPELNINNPDIDTVILASYKGRYLLIDFWASWCVPCRKENPQLVKTYRKYKPKGFDIVGVSFDEDKQDWRKAIQKDKLTWKQVTDFKGWESPIVNLYGLGAIPANVLLDKEGKIIAKDLFGEALTNKLAEVMP